MILRGDTRAKWPGALSARFSSSFKTIDAVNLAKSLQSCLYVVLSRIGPSSLKSRYLTYRLG
jgi:hypothetical protein